MRRTSISMGGLALFASIETVDFCTKGARPSQQRLLAKVNKTNRVTTLFAHIDDINAGTGRPAALSQAAIALTTGLTAGRRVIRSRHSSSLGVLKVTGAP
jgi:hypothetical protein